MVGHLKVEGVVSKSNAEESFHAKDKQLTATKSLDTVRFHVSSDKIMGSIAEQSKNSNIYSIPELGDQ